MRFIERLLACWFGAALITGVAAAQETSESTEHIPAPELIEDSYPLQNAAARERTTQLLQQLVVDLLAIYNNYKEAHWNLTGPLFVPLHEYYDEQAATYLDYSDLFAERVLAMAYSVDGRYATIARTTTIPNMPAGYVSDHHSLRLLIDQVSALKVETYRDIARTEEPDPTTSNMLQELAHDIDYNLWQLRAHLTKPGSQGQNLPWAAPQQ